MNACVLCGRSEFRPLFSATDRLYRTTDRAFQVVACAGCGMMSLSPQPNREELSHYYPFNYWYTPDSSLAARLEESYRRMVLRDHVRFVTRALAAGQGLVLDVGCGGGLFSRMLRERGFDAIGLDSSPEAAAVGWKTNGVPVICGELPAAPLGAGSCAAITMFHVLEHLADPRAYLETAYCLLAPRGRLVVQVPNASCWQFKLLRGRWNGVDIPRHLSDFRVRDLTTLLTAAGFTVTRAKHFSLRDNPAGLATSLAPALDPMARRVRGLREAPVTRIGKDLAYFALVFASIPFTALEAACGAGSTIMVEARKPA